MNPTMRSPAKNQKFAQWKELTIIISILERARNNNNNNSTGQQLTIQVNSWHHGKTAATKPFVEVPKPYC
jgi:hypothetical protein